MIAIALVSAMATAFHGVIAFIGLIAPHIARRLVGDDHSLLIPFSSLLGALLLLSADTIGRLAIGSGTLPVGVITSFLGAPAFLYLLTQEYQ
jgi:iron complex transport system permease protein